MSFPIGYFRRAWNVKAKTQQRSKNGRRNSITFITHLKNVFGISFTVTPSIDAMFIFDSQNYLILKESLGKMSIIYKIVILILPKSGEKKNWRKVRLDVPRSTLPSVRHILFHLPALSCHLPVWSNWQMCLQKSFKCAQEVCRAVWSHLIGNFAPI